MQVKDLRLALEDIEAIFADAGAKGPQKDLTALLGLLEEHDAEQLDSFLEELRLELAIKKPARTPRKVVPAAVDEVLVASYSRRLLEAGVDAIKFREAFEELKSDARVRKAELDHIAEKYLAQHAKSKAKLLASIESRFRAIVFDQQANDMAKRATPW